MPWIRQEFISYLEDTLIPDLRASGLDATADDFETCIHFMKSGRLDNQMDNIRVIILVETGSRVIDRVAVINRDTEAHDMERLTHANKMNDCNYNIYAASPDTVEDLIQFINHGDG